MQKLKQTGLGRGLSALLPEADSKDDQGRLLAIPVADIHPNPLQPRRDFKPEELSDLADSIREKGIIQPLVVRRLESRKTPGGSQLYELIAGERRLRAAQIARFAEVPARIIEITDEQEMLELALIENLQREDLNPVELARGYQKLAEDFTLTQEQIAARVGKNRATVANTLRVLELPETILHAVRSGEISMGHAKAILMLQGAARQSALFKKIVSGRLSVRQTEETARMMLQLTETQAKDPVQVPKPAFIEQTDRLRKRLGTQVKISKKGRRGTIKIEFYSDEDLERIMDVITAQAEDD